MGALQSLPGQQEYRDLAEKTGFSCEQIGVLHKRFKQLSHNEETLQRTHFNEIPDLACNPIRSQIIGAFFDKRNFCQNGEGTVEEISFEEFLVVMSHFKPPSLHMTEEQRESVRREKLRFLFNMHDTDNDGTITLEEYRHVVEELLSRSGALKETAKSIADAAMLEVAGISMGHMLSLELILSLRHRSTDLHVSRVLLANQIAWFPPNLPRFTLQISSDSVLQENGVSTLPIYRLGNLIEKRYTIQQVPNTVLDKLRPAHLLHYEIIKEPDEFYEGITFEHFLKLLNGFEIESKMNIRFLNMDTTTLCK